MLVAHLRGLLEPTYPQGIRSRMREHLVLTAIGLEKEADYLASLLTVQVGMLVPNASQSYKETVRRLNHGLRQVKELHEVHVIESATAASSLDDIVKLHHALQDKGIITG